MSNIEWTEAEKQVAQTAFKTAQAREAQAIIEEVRKTATAIVDLEEVWRLHDFLSARRHEMDGKYDYRYSNLIFVFAQLVSDGWLSLDDLEGLSQEKRTKISVLSQM
ncbi:hypothetical protein PN462_17155 [Spirulina sp. CS-785/01]|nr:hypothetical protein [Spirulina sp. CS-785/01]MDB9314845.1 hypothetical protein [Spirulina sp. CS-785/01]